MEKKKIIMMIQEEEMHKNQPGLRCGKQHEERREKKKTSVTNTTWL
jgi:hypothetical protein